ncbi:MAG: DUF6340 family protein [Deltaproteobacteria bacterium]|jgi:tetratricopeptide (TPR) repeat protein|nr:DUF6340 family protein [Deltaproteobacteria bacterium]
MNDIKLLSSKTKLSENQSGGGRRIVFSLLACIVCLALASALLGCSAKAPKRRLPQGLQIGTITGEGGDLLSSELKRLDYSAGKKPAGGLKILSGETSFSLKSIDGLEKVASSGASIPATERPNEPSSAQSDSDARLYPFTMTEAVFELNWTIHDENSGLAVAAGTTKDTLKLSTGGYLAGQGKAPHQPPTEEQALKQLAPALADQLIQELGPSFSSSALLAGDDEISKKAAALAAGGNWDEAGLLWEELVELNPEYYVALYNLGLHHERKGELEEAYSYYRLAFLSDSSDLTRQALTRLTDSLNRLDRTPGAE